MQELINLRQYKKRNASVNSNCGVFGIANHSEAAIMTYYGLHSLQHRGQEAAGIVSCEKINDTEKYRFNLHKDHGLVLSVFNENILTDTLKGNSAIGHTRYSTTGSSDKRTNIQPFKVIYKSGNLALSHNGNLTNTKALRESLQDNGTLFQTTTDSELILHLIARSKETAVEDKIKEAFSKVEGAYSICILTDTKLIAVRDPHGVRPFCVGILDDKSSIFTSETCALDIINAEYLREVEPGEMIVVDTTGKNNNLESYQLKSLKKYHHCIFEYVYFSRPDSQVFGEKVDKVRRRIGKSLALQSPPPFKSEDDKKRVVVINVPDSSNTATLGYFTESVKHNNDIKNEIGLIRSHYVGRTFIQPGQDKREMKVRTKFNIVKGVLAERKVVIVDDSIVRGTTSKLLVGLIKKAKPKEIHMKITSPPVISPCYYGMDFPSKNELIANKQDGDINKIKQELGVDELSYLTCDNLLSAVPYTKPETGYCTACFTGIYPIPVEETGEMNKENFDD